MDDSRPVQPPAPPASGQPNQLPAPSAQLPAHSSQLPADSAQRPALLPEEERDVLLIKLLFAASRLAAREIYTYGFSGRLCTVCAASAVGSAPIEHTATCDVGRIEDLIARLAQWYERAVDRAAEEPAASAEYGEPWYVDPSDQGNVRNRESLLVLDGYGSELFGADEEVYAARMVACVNACAGVSTEALLRGAARPAARGLHGVDALFGCKAPEIKTFPYPEAAEGGVL